MKINPMIYIYSEDVFIFTNDNMPHFILLLKHRHYD